MRYNNMHVSFVKNKSIIKSTLTLLLFYILSINCFTQQNIYLHSSDVETCFTKDHTPLNDFNLLQEGRRKPVFETIPSNLCDKKNEGDNSVIRPTTVKFINEHGIGYIYKINSGNWFYKQSSEGAINLRNGTVNIIVQPSNNQQKWEAANYDPSIWQPTIWGTYFFKVLVGVLVILIIYIIYCVFKYNKLKKLRQLTLAEMYHVKLLNASINSHFIYNVLNSIRYFIYTSQSEKAGLMLDSFAPLIRNTVENSANIFIKLSIELKNLKRYVDVAKMRHEASILLLVDNKLSESDPLIPFLLLQPFVENSIQHGYRKEIDPYIILVNVKEEIPGISFKITIEDFGKSLNNENKPSVPENMSKHSYGIYNIKERLKYLYAKQSPSSTLNVIDKTTLNEKGYLIEIILPLKAPSRYLDV